MEWQFALLIILGGLVVLLLTGMPVAMAFIIIDVVGLYMVAGELGLGQLFSNMRDAVTMWVIIPVVLFILLGMMTFESGLGSKALDAVDMWLGRVPGRLGLVAIGGGTLLATLTGDSTGSVAMLTGTMAPEMEKRGYKKSMSLGPIFGASTLAPMIPPSGPIVLFACLAQLSVGKLLMAGIFPGLLMATLYATYIILRCCLQPSIAPPYNVSPMPLAKKLKSTIVNIVPIGIIIFLVIGVIFMGIATPSEAAATGAFGIIILAGVYRHLSWKVLKTTFLTTARISGMLLAILLGAIVFGQVLAYTGCTQGLLNWISTFPFPPIAIIITLLLFMGFLGCFMDALAIMVIVIPIYMPIIYQLGFDPLWFVILLLITMEIGLASPPFGLVVFVMKGILPPDVKISEIYKAAAPILGCAALAIAIIIAFPEIATWLPSKMITR